LEFSLAVHLAARVTFAHGRIFSLVVVDQESDMMSSVVIHALPVNLLDVNHCRVMRDMIDDWLTLYVDELMIG
jgi:hypothetical protein